LKIIKIGWTDPDSWSIVSTMNTKHIAYYRVSTTAQGLSGLGLDAQRSLVIAYCAANHATIIAEHVEVESGRNDDRVQLQAAMADCRKHKAVLIVANVSRLARSVRLVAELLESDVRFVAADMPSADRFVIQIMSTIAELEARQISERTKRALAEAKKRGVKLGAAREGYWNGRNPQEVTQVARDAARASAATARTNTAIVAKPLATEMRSQGKTLAEIADVLNARSVPTQRGGQWFPAQVRTLLAA
jgi:DNA invertase Pin-like site-specific DNA recombinase